MNRTIILLIATAALTASAHADVYGTSPLIQQTSYLGTDYCQGCIISYLPIPAVGTTLESWAFYASEISGDPTAPNPGPTTGNLITPLLLQQISTNVFEVIGIGTTRTSTGTGIQSYSFGTVAGTDVIGANDWFGWRDDSAAGTGQTNGTISLSLTGGTGINYSPFPDDSAVTVGKEYSTTLAADRVYSVQVTTPEAGSLPTTAFLLLSLAGFISLRRFKQA